MVSGNAIWRASFQPAQECREGQEHLSHNETFLDQCMNNGEDSEGWMKCID